MHRAFLSVVIVFLLGLAASPGSAQYNYASDFPEFWPGNFQMFTPSNGVIRQRDSVYMTRDSCRSWVRLAGPASASYESIDGKSSNTTWGMVFESPSKGVRFGYSSGQWAPSRYGFCGWNVYSYDSGKSWSKAKVGTDCPIPEGVYRTFGRRLYYQTHYGDISVGGFKTRGTVQSFDTENDSVRILCAQEAGTNKLHRSDDSGSSWKHDEYFDTIDGGPALIRATGSGNWFLSTAQRSFVSSDDGISWTPSATSQGFYHLRFSEHGIGYAAKGENVIFRTSDRGNNWIPIPVNTHNRDGIYVEVVNDTTAYLATDAGIVGVFGSHFNPAPIVQLSSRSVYCGLLRPGSDTVVRLRAFNAGSIPLRLIGYKSSSPLFSITFADSLVQPSDSTILLVRFVANSDRDTSAVITIESTGFLQVDTIRVSGAVSRAKASPRDSVVDFGTVTAGATAYWNLTIRNTGYETMMLDSVVLPLGRFSVRSFDTLPVNVGKTLRLLLAYSPQEQGYDSNSLVIYYNGVPISIRVIGRGLDPADTLSFQRIPLSSFQRNTRLVAVSTLGDGLGLLEESWDSVMSNATLRLLRFDLNGANQEVTEIGPVCRVANGYSVHYALGDDRAGGAYVAYEHGTVGLCRVDRNGSVEWRRKAEMPNALRLKAFGVAPDHSVWIGTDRPNGIGNAQGDIVAYHFDAEGSLVESPSFHRSGIAMFPEMKYLPEYFQALAIDSLGKFYASIALDESRVERYESSASYPWYLIPGHPAESLTSITQYGWACADGNSNVYHATDDESSVLGYLHDSTRWLKRFPLDRRIRRLHPDNQGGVFAAGYIDDERTLQDSYVTRIDSTGKELWTTRMGSYAARPDYFIAMDVSPDAVYLAALVHEFDTSYLRVQTIDASGLVLTQNSLDIPSSFGYGGSTADNFGNWWVAGSTIESGVHTPLLVRFRGSTTNLTAASSAKQFAEHLEVRPNPASAQIRLSGPNVGMGPLQVRVINVIGQEMRTATLPSLDEPIELPHLISGTYFISVQNQAGNRWEAKFSIVEDR